MSDRHPPTAGPAAPAIGYVLTHHPRTSQTFIEAEIEALRRRGTTVAVFAMNEPAADQLRTEAARTERSSTTYLKAAGGRGVVRAVASAARTRPTALAAVVVLALRTARRDPRALLRRAAHLAEALIVWDEARRRDVAVLHAHFAQAPSTIAWLAAELGRRSGVGPDRHVITIHGLGEMAAPDEDLPAEKVASAAVVRFVCQAALDHFRGLGRPAVTRVVRCGIDLEAFAPRGSRPRHDPPRIVVVGRLSRAKGQHDAIDAVAQVRRDGTDVELVLIGSGEDGPELRARTARLGADGWVRFAGELEPAAVRRELDDADVMCLPSYDEGLPMAIMEAMAVGCPVVATAIAGIPELVVDGESGRLVRPGDVDALAAALTEAVTDEAARARWVSAGLRAVEERHDQRRTLVELLELLDGAAGPSDAAGRP